jgi:putative sterol carrier protein
VHSVTLSETKILKQAENGGNSAVDSIFRGLGMKDESKYPTPQEFVRATHGLDGREGQTSGMLGGNPFAGLTPGGGSIATLPPGMAPSVNMSLLQSLSSGQQVQLGPGVVAGPGGIVASPTGLKETMPSNWGSCLESIIATEFSNVEEDAQGVYKLEISETENGTDTYYIEMTTTKRSVLTTPPAGKKPDVSMAISSSDLAEVLAGSLAPLQAYLTGRISASGDVRKLMLFDKLSRRGHKTGSMFSV